MVGAILTQSTAWTNVEKAVAALKERGLLEPRRLLSLPPAALARLIRPAGYFRVKARRLRSFVAWYLTRFGGDVRRMRRVPVPRLRKELLEVHGIGPETADSILLYALGLPSFVVDAYTKRVLTRHGLAPADVEYAGMKALFEGSLPHDAALFNEYHALLVAVGKEHCGPTPRCETCPLRRFGGPGVRAGKKNPPASRPGGVRLPVPVTAGGRRWRSPRGSR
jgi:endonuclease-3 related protein